MHFLLNIWIFQCHVSNEKNPGCLVYIGGYTTQLYRDYFISHDIRIPFLNNQYFMESVGPGFFRGSGEINQLTN